MVNFLVGYHTIVFDGSDVVCPSLYVWYGVVWYAVHQQALIDWVTDEKNRRFSIQQEEKDSIIEAIQNTKLTENKLQYQKEFVEWVEGQIVKGTGTETEQELAGKAVEKDRFTPNEAKKIIVMISCASFGVKRSFFTAVPASSGSVPVPVPLRICPSTHSTKSF